MRFALDDDREALRSTARELLTELCPASAVRAAWTGVPDEAAWNALADIGALAVLVPESDGGLGLDETYLVPVVEEAGQTALPHPLTETALVAAPLGVAGPMVATDLGGAGLVASATFAEAFLLVSGRGLRLYEAHEVDVEPVETVDASRHCGRVRPRAGGRSVTEDPEAVAAAFDRGVLGAAAELLGLSRAMLGLTAGYATQRHQFGKPIGSFQAVKHLLANARLEIEFAAPAVLYAAYAIAHGQPDASRSVSQAKWLAGSAAAVTGRAALQCHGAIGYTTEHDLHLYLKRSWALARAWGSADFHADRVAASISA
ncbi:MAG: acyl-CoA dehydrogenase [Acidimicrobiaceae bacterium]|nr:acyl-CoA dehydrogenase [Acidimicrobiaceae bacterium]MXY11450.1 acyl-CoA dehydrogenase [Acidimicrobiaceae bacterium]MXZ64179.1 acyl-CoA dehydrogenase [Acidimicrobiaceae bacterium]MYF33490.1 acyl-CoA dehydrogenase [Acidimicrobiaceae bacterium]MYG79240.1 acyl-CoA dehydrogenase [Acidimicrobiaceae bacterium]